LIFLGNKSNSSSELLEDASPTTNIENQSSKDLKFRKDAQTMSQTTDEKPTTVTEEKNNSTANEVLLSPKPRARRVLFVIAHPDDECMFFGPSILHFTQKEKAMVFLICFTNGWYHFVFY